MKLLNITILKNALFCLMAMLFFAACEQNKCKTRAVNCLNEGSCFDGVCNCPAGWDGDSCQNTENLKFVAKYGGVILSSNGSSQLGTNDTLVVEKISTDNSGITMKGKKSPENITIVAKVKNNAISVTNFLATNKWTYNGAGSLNGKLLTLTMYCDSLDINGITTQHIEYTFSGTKH